MNRTFYTCALLVLMVTSAACSFKIFEDVGSDPHPPTVGVIGIAVYVEPDVPDVPVVTDVPPPVPTTDMAASPARGRSVTWDSGGFTLTVGQKFQVGIVYTDAGGDIEKFQLRDRDGVLKIGCLPKDQTYFSGTSGAVICVENGYELTGILGRHRLELWAEDSQLSRSEKVEFVITLAP